MIKQRTTLEFLSYLRGRDVHLSIRDDQLACSAPKGVLTSDLTAELKERKQAILEFLRTTASESSVSEAPIRAVRRDEQARPSLAQERMWFLEQFEQHSTAYNISFGLRFRGELNREVLERSFREVIRRHEVLRTRLVNVNGAVKGIVKPVGDWNIELRSLTVMQDSAQKVELKRLAAEEAAHRFDLTEDVLVRACLIVLGEADQALLVTLHHISADGQSLGIFSAELTQLYAAFLKGESSGLAEPELQYADFADWDRRSTENGVFQSEILYWRKKLRAPLAVTELPIDRPRPATMTYRGATIMQTLDIEVYEAVRAFAASRKATPFVMLLAALKVLLYRFTSQADVIVGSATAGRGRKELEPLIGLFINNLVLRTDLSGTPTSEDVIARVRDTVLNAFANEHVTLDRLLDVLKPSRELNRSPLFQVMFILQNVSSAWPTLPGLEIEMLELDPGTTRYDFTIEAFEDPQRRMRMAWQYNTALFDASTIERMQASYVQILLQMISEPERSICELKIVSAAEQELLLHRRAQTAYPSVCVHEWFARQAALSPNAIAAVCGGEELTYGRLLEQVCRMANRLRAMGVGPDVLVAVCTQRSMDMLVAVLGVLTAGGAYVPLDPEYPAERLDYMLADSGARILVTEELLLSGLARRALPTICIDRDRAMLLEADTTAPETGVKPENLAYVIYTSGSTGKPKGVEVTHRSVVNLLASFAQQLGVNARDRLLAVTTLSFDIAGLELYLPLVSGARVILARRETVWDGALLMELMEQTAPTMMQATPVTWRLLLDAGWTASPGFRILCGGEALPLELARRLVATGGEVWNLYGPTETTIWSTSYRVETIGATMPVGRPIENTELYVLDANQQLLPMGVPGELYIGGDGLARGYLGRPELTAEKFVAHPFRAADRLYRTGDLVRWVADGNLEYMGRLDHQVKLRGFRIELGEIEAALEQQLDIEGAVVVMHDDSAGEPRLTAYVMTHDGVPIDASALREALSRKLSGYMVPSSFVRMDKLPLTPNGKVDRKALAALPFEVATSTAYVAPRTDAEQKVAEIWKELLRVEQIGMSDNFFDRGGYSLLVVQLQSHLRRQFQKEISLVELFQHPTVASQAELVVQRDPVTEVVGSPQ